MFQALRPTAPFEAANRSPSHEPRRLSSSYAQQMVTVDITPTEVVIRPRGLHRLWTLKREVRIPRRQLKRVEAGVAPDARARLSHSLRLPGTSVPWLITAGSYRSRGQWAFWDVVGGGEKAVTLTTEGHRYTELVVDVEEPAATVDAVKRAIRQR